LAFPSAYRGTVFNASPYSHPDISRVRLAKKRAATESFSPFQSERRNGFD
jgi:hypothetical protein